MNMNLGKGIATIGAGILTGLSAITAVVLDLKRTKKFDTTNDEVVKTEYVRRKFWQNAVDNYEEVSDPSDEENLINLKKSVEP